MKRDIYLISLLILILFGCSFKNSVISGSDPIIKGIEQSIFKEKNIKMVEQSLPSIIKIAEGVYEYHPDSAYLCGKLCFLYAAYSFAFYDNSPFSDFDPLSEKKKEEMTYFYEKAYTYGMKAMDLYIKGFSSTMGNPKQQQLLFPKVKEKHIETLFWMTFSRLLILFNNIEKTELLMELETLKQYAECIKIVKGDFLYGSVFAIFQAFYGGRTKTLGGNFDKSQLAYKEGQVFAEGKSLILDYVFVRYVSTQLPTSEAFDNKIYDIYQFDIDSYPDFIFINNLIVQKTKAIQKKRDFLF